MLAIIVELSAGQWIECDGINSIQGIAYPIVWYSSLVMDAF